MNPAIGRALRLVHILERLRAGEALLSSDLAREYGCSQRSIERDFRALAQAPFGLPLTQDDLTWAWSLRRDENPRL